MTLNDAIEAILQEAMSKAKWFGMYRYQVRIDPTSHELAGIPIDDEKTDSESFATLVLIDSVPGLPSMLRVPKTYGSHGLKCLSDKDQVVLVSFEAGDPSRPYVASYYSYARPVSITIDAKDSIQIGTIDASNADMKVWVGSTGHRQVARNGDKVDCGTFTVTSLPSSVQLSWKNPYTNLVKSFGTLAVAGGALVFTPDPVTGGSINVIGKIIEGSSVLATQ